MNDQLPASDRRQFLKTAALASLAPIIASAADGRPPRILLRSSWQTVNIGDIAHTPGVLAILEEHLPEAEITLWPSNVENGVAELLMARFPKLRIKKTWEIEHAFERCDFLLHSSGASLVAQNDVKKWASETGKPYGVYGITFPRKKSSATEPSSDAALQEAIRILSAADFVFFRDSKSMELAKSLGCASPVMEFGPDGAFACDLHDEEKAVAYLEANGLEEGKFLCCIPRLRYTPYWTIPAKKRDIDPVKHARNEEMKAHDHAPLIKGIIDIVEQTEMMVLLCPEDETQMQVGKEIIYDELPEAIQKRVVWRENYWLTGEATSVYVRSAGLFGNEMHSPIMCIGHGIPAIVCRWAEQTTKGYMWQDIGLGDWLFDLDDESQVAKVAPAILAMAQDPAAAKAKAAKARAFVEKRQRETMEVVAKSV